MSSTRGEKFSTTASALAINAFARVSPRGRERSSVMPRLPALMPWYIADHSHQRSAVGCCVLAKRMPSGRWIDSTLMTSAPRTARKWPTKGPAQNMVKSSTRRPAKGRALPSPTDGAGCEVHRAACSPSRGAGVNGRSAPRPSR